MIRTPDQRVRIFVSSTIQELAPERALARQTISGLHLSPVLFEMGARPHPPRDLYRAYLAQSDVFVGIYWQSYGWVAPTMDISGLEDEFELSGGKPRLIYIKEPAPERQPRLGVLLDRIRASDSAAYQRFEMPEQLGALLADDLAVLLSERFTASAGSVVHPASHEPVAAALPRSVPEPRGKFVGREGELSELEALLVRPDVRLLTLTGPGGTGKSRLALELTSRVAGRFADGVGFVSLGEIREVDEFPGKLARDLGLQDTGRQPLAETIRDYVTDKSMLLVIDNFEHVLAAAPLVSEMLNTAPELTVMVTSRAPLRLTVEREYPMSPLPHPRGLASDLGSELAYPAVELFVARAREANTRLAFDSAQLEAIAEISRALDGLPLAIELAAARTRYVDPRTLVGHMGTTLDVLSRGPRDLPGRQQTMRATIAWSENLLEEQGRRLFRRMAVLSGESSLDSLEAVTNWEGDLGVGLLDEIENLVDLGLVRLSTPDQWLEPRFSMLRTVREYAMEKLDESGEADRARAAHASHFLDLAEGAEPYFWTPERHLWLDHVSSKLENLRQAFAWFAAQDDFASLWRLGAALGPYLAIRGPQGEALQLLSAVGVDAGSATPMGLNGEIAGAMMREIGILHTLTGEFMAARPYLQRAVALLEEAGDQVGKARALGYLGVAGISVGDGSAMAELTSGYELGRELGDVYSTAIASTFMAEVSAAFGDIESAREYALAANEMCREAEDHWLLGLTLIQRGNLAIGSDDMEEAITAATESHRLLAEEGSSLAGWPKVGLGYCHLRLDEPDVAAKHFDDGVQLGRRAGDKTIVLAGFIGLAGVAAAKGDAMRAGRLLGAAEVIMETLGYQMWSGTLVMYNLVNDLFVIATSTEAERARLREAGRVLTYDESIALAGS